MNKHMQARSLTLLGIILQSLHLLFGITAIMGVLITHMRLASAENTIYYSHLRWQIVTFWSAFAGYAIAFWLWIGHQQIWLLVVVGLFVMYRLLVSIGHFYTNREIQRLL